MLQMKTLNGYEVYDAVSRGYLTPVVSTGDVSEVDGETYCQNYIATVEGVTTLENGISFTMIPHADNASLPTLNVNNLGTKQIRQRLSTNNAATITIEKEGLLMSNHPIRLTYDGAFPAGGCWIIDIVCVDYNAIYGAAPVKIVTWDASD